MVKVITAVEKPTNLNAHNSPLEGAMQLKQVPLDFSFRFLSGGILFSKLFSDSQKSNHGSMKMTMVFGRIMKF